MRDLKILFEGVIDGRKAEMKQATERKGEKGTREEGK